MWLCQSWHTYFRSLKRILGKQLCRSWTVHDHDIFFEDSKEYPTGNLASLEPYMIPTYLLSWRTHQQQKGFLWRFNASLVDCAQGNTNNSKFWSYFSFNVRRHEVSVHDSTNDLMIKINSKTIFATNFGLLKNWS